MYELDSLKKFLESVSALESKTNMSAEDYFKSHVSADPTFTRDRVYPHMLGSLCGHLYGLIREAQYALRDSIPSVEKQLALMNRFMNALEDFDITPSISHKTGEIQNERELKLLELLKTERYRSEWKDLRERILVTLSDVENDAYDREHDEAEDALKAAGFELWARDDFGGWERIVTFDGKDYTERVVIESRYEGPHTARNWRGYSFRLEGITRLEGVSGEFHKLLEAIKTPPASEKQPYTDGSGVGVPSGTGEGK